MEIKEAIERLKRMYDPITYGIPMDPRGEEAQNFEAICMAISALEKQELLEAANAYLKSMQKILIETQNMSLPTLDISLPTHGEMVNNSHNQKIDR